MHYIDCKLARKVSMINFLYQNLYFRYLKPDNKKSVGTARVMGKHNKEEVANKNNNNGKLISKTLFEQVIELIIFS